MTESRATAAAEKAIAPGETPVPANGVLPAAPADAASAITFTVSPNRTAAGAAQPDSPDATEAGRTRAYRPPASGNAGSLESPAGDSGRTTAYVSPQTPPASPAPSLGNSANPANPLNAPKVYEEEEPDAPATSNAKRGRESANVRSDDGSSLGLTAAPAVPAASGARFSQASKSPDPIAAPSSSLGAATPPPPLPAASREPAVASSSSAGNPSAVGARFSNDTARQDVFGTKPGTPEVIRERRVERQIETRQTLSGSGSSETPSESKSTESKASEPKSAVPNARLTEAEVRKMADAQLRALVDERDFSDRPLEERATMMVEAQRRFGSDSEQS